jgi:hypothetical protein
MARDLFHDVVKSALIKDGWTITDDPLFLKVGGVDFLLILAQKNFLLLNEMAKKSPLRLKALLILQVSLTSILRLANLLTIELL